MIVASDGVWELLTNEQVANIVKRAAKTYSESQRIAQAIVEEASYQWMVEEGDYRDDITVVLLFFPWQTEAMLK